MKKKYKWKNILRKKWYLKKNGLTGSPAYWKTMGHQHGRKFLSLLEIISTLTKLILNEYWSAV